MADYYVLVRDPDPSFCAIYDTPDDMPNLHFPVDGLPLGSSTYQYVFDMAADVPGIVVPDVINNTFGYTLISARMRQFLEDRAGAGIEYVPFRLRNHKGRFVDAELYIANVLGSVDCVDRSRTAGRDDPVNPGRYSKITRLVFDPSRLDPELNLFRLAVRPKYLVLREDLKAAMEAEGLTGAAFLRVGDEVKLR